MEYQKKIVFKSNVGKRKPNLCGKKAITQDMDWTFQFVVARTRSLSEVRKGEYDGSCMNFIMSTFPDKRV